MSKDMIASVTVAGRDHRVLAGGRRACSWCLQEGSPTMHLGASDDYRPGACEACVLLAALAWRRLSGDAVPGQEISVIPREARVVVATSQEPGSGSVRKVLLVERHEQRVLPGASLLFGYGESPVAAAIRGLREDTGIETWLEALNPLYVGMTSRGVPVRVYVARAWHWGAPGEKERRADWHGDDFPKWTGASEWFNQGVAEALDARFKAKSPSTLMGKSAVMALEARLPRARGGAADVEADKLAMALLSVMTDEEKEAMSLVLAEARRNFEATSPVASRPSAEPVEERSEDEGEAPEVEGDWEDSEGSMAPGRPGRGG